MRTAEMIQPASVIETDRLYNEGVAFPFSDSLSEPLRIGILRKLPAVRPNFTQCASPFEQLQHSIFDVNDLDRPAEEEETRVAEWIAVTFRIVSQRGWNLPRS